RGRDGCGRSREPARDAAAQAGDGDPPDTDQRLFGERGGSAKRAERIGGEGQRPPRARQAHRANGRQGMTRTDDLIAQLAAEARPVRPAGPRLAAALVGGGLIALLIMMAFFGAPLKALPNTGTTALAVKLGFTLALALIAATACLAAGRPGDRPLRRLIYLIAPLLVVGSVAAYVLLHA